MRHSESGSSPLLAPFFFPAESANVRKGIQIHSDDTPVPMLVPGKGKTAQGRLWAYVVDDRASGANGHDWCGTSSRRHAAAPIRKPD
ncbi:IS66 family transposase [Croceicoccus marinus]|uniref:IS66 family transposase n=1 Tax=Croceicoccus marinus TaxID=450378 RepID=UPI0039F45449